MDRDSVLECESGVVVLDVGGLRVALELGNERRERVLEAAQEVQYLGAGEHGLHHHESHQVQPEVGCDSGWVDGGADPGEVELRPCWVVS